MNTKQTSEDIFTYNIIPIHKKEDKELVANKRPTSLFVHYYQVFGKIDM